MLLVTAFASSACEPSSFGGTRAWRNPAAATSSEPLPPAPPPVLPDAVLTMSKVAVTVVPGTDPPVGFSYEFRFELKETGGRSGATIGNVFSSVDTGQTEATGPECWRDVMRVPPGGTMVDFDSGWMDLSYCAPWSWSSREATRFTVTVHYTDDEGRQGSLAVTGPVAR